MIFDIEKLKKTSVDKWHNLIIIPLNNNLKTRRATSNYGSNYTFLKAITGGVSYSKSYMAFEVSISGKVVATLNVSDWMADKEDTLLTNFLEELHTIVLKDKIELLEL